MTETNSPSSDCGKTSLGSEVTESVPTTLAELCRYQTCVGKVKPSSSSCLFDYPISGQNETNTIEQNILKSNECLIKDIPRKCFKPNSDKKSECSNTNKIITKCLLTDDMVENLSLKYKHGLKVKTAQNAQRYLLSSSDEDDGNQRFKNQKKFFRRSWPIQRVHQRRWSGGSRVERQNHGDFCVDEQPKQQSIFDKRTEHIISDCTKKPIAASQSHFTLSREADDAQICSVLSEYLTSLTDDDSSVQSGAKLVKTTTTKAGTKRKIATKRISYTNEEIIKEQHQTSQPQQWSKNYSIELSEQWDNKQKLTDCERDLYSEHLKSDLHTSNAFPNEPENNTQVGFNDTSFNDLKIGEQNSKKNNDSLKERVLRQQHQKHQRKRSYHFLGLSSLKHETTSEPLLTTSCRTNIRTTKDRLYSKSLRERCGFNNTLTIDEPKDCNVYRNSPLADISEFDDLLNISLEDSSDDNSSVAEQKDPDSKPNISDTYYFKDSIRTVQETLNALINILKPVDKLDEDNKKDESDDSQCIAKSNDQGYYALSDCSNMVGSGTNESHSLLKLSPTSPSCHHQSPCPCHKNIQNNGHQYLTCHRKESTLQGPQNEEESNSCDESLLLSLYSEKLDVNNGDKSQTVCPDSHYSIENPPNPSLSPRAHPSAILSDSKSNMPDLGSYIYQRTNGKMHPDDSYYYRDHRESLSEYNRQSNTESDIKSSQSKSRSIFSLSTPSVVPTSSGGGLSLESPTTSSSSSSLASAITVVPSFSYESNKDDCSLDPSKQYANQVMFYNDKNKENVDPWSVRDNRSVSRTDSQISSTESTDSNGSSNNSSSSSSGGVDIYINELHYDSDLEEEEYKASALYSNEYGNENDISVTHSPIYRSDPSSDDLDDINSNEVPCDDEKCIHNTPDDESQPLESAIKKCCLLRSKKTYRSTSLLNKLINESPPPKTFTCPCISMLDGQTISMRRRSNKNQSSSKRRPNSCSFLTNGSLEKQIHIGQKRFSLYNFDEVLPKFWDRENPPPLSRTNSVTIPTNDKVMTSSFTQEKLHQRSKEDLETLLEQTQQQVQVVSEKLVELLQERHELVEQVEMRRIGIEQLCLLRPELKEQIQQKVQEEIQKQKNL